MASNPNITVTSKDEASAALKRIERQLDGLSSSANRLGKSLVSAVSVGTVVEAFRRIVGALDDLDESAQALGTTAVALAEFRKSASDSGVSAEKFDVALTRLNVKMVDAAGGNKQAAAAFRTLGIELRSSSGQLKTTEEVLGEVANKFQTYRDGAEKSALAVELFGKAGAAMIPFLNQGAEGLRKFSGVTDESVKAAIKLQAQFDQLKTGIQAAGISLATQLIPFLTRTIEEFNAARNAGQGFFGTLSLLASQSAQTLEDPGKKIAALTDELGKLQKRRAEISAGRSSLFEFGSDNEKSIQGLQAELKFLKEIQVNRALANNASNYSNEGREALKIPPIIKAIGTAEKERVSASQSALASYIDGLNKQINKLNDVSEKEKALQFLRANPGIDTAQTRELLVNLSAQVDKLHEEEQVRLHLIAITREQAQAQRELRDAKDKQGVDELKQLEDNNKRLRELTGQADDDRRKADADLIISARIRGEITDEQLRRALDGTAALKDEIEKTESAAERLGLVFVSSLGEFIKNPGDGKNFFKALAEDVLQLTTQILILEPLMKAIRSGVSGNTSGGSTDYAGVIASIFGSLFAGAGADGMSIPAGKFGLVGERGPEFVSGGTSGKTITPMGGGSTVNIMVQGSVTRETASQLGANISRQLTITNRRFN